jgi:hypothetical protein
MPSAWDQTFTDHYFAQLAFQGPSGLPEDQFITTYMFRNDNVFDRNGMLDAVEAALVLFFTNEFDTTGTTILNFIPGAIDPPVLKIFDMGEAPPRFPEERVVTALNPTNSVAQLPYEVAACVSYHNGGPGPRNRGRIYIGPLVTTAITSGGNNGAPMMATEVLNIFSAAAEALATDPGLECTWVHWSRANAELYPVVGGWVDNAPDTQRRRGIAPSTRTTWGGAISSGSGGFPGGRSDAGTP